MKRKINYFLLFLFLVSIIAGCGKVSGESRAEQTNDNDGYAGSKKTDTVTDIGNNKGQDDMLYGTEDEDISLMRTVEV